MTATPSHFHRGGFTMIELLIGASVSTGVALAIFAFLQMGSILSAKNLSLNLSTNSLRTALDRVEQVLTQGDGTPVLINTTGATVASGAGSAAGVKFDRFVGGPFVITSPLAPLPTSTSSLVLTRSTHAAAAAPIPRIGDLLRIDSTKSTLRPRIATVTPGVIVGSRQQIAVTFSSPLGVAVSPLASTIMTAKLVRHVAFIVMPSNGRSELRYYDSYDTTTNLNDPAKYVVVTDQLSPVGADTTPFAVKTYSGRNFINFAVRVRASTHDQRLVGKQADEFNNFARVDTLIRPKVAP